MRNLCSKIRREHNGLLYRQNPHHLQYPTDTRCEYLIKGRPGQQILIHFEQFALYGSEKEGEL